MKADENGYVNFLHFPCKETSKVMAEMKKAAKAGDLAALQRCARLMQWLCDAFKNDPCPSDEPFEFDGPFSSIREFNAAWKKEVEMAGNLSGA